MTVPSPAGDPVDMTQVEIQTCADWRGDGASFSEGLVGGTRHRWHCLYCNEKGPAEVDGAVCRFQFKQHKCKAGLTDHG